MKALLLPLTLVSVGCSGTVDGVYQVPPGHYEGSGDSIGDPGSGNGGEGMDAAICKVVGAASVTGALGTATLVAKDAVEIFDDSASSYTVRVTDYASACTMGDSVHAGGTVLSFRYADTVLTSATYDLAQTPKLTVTFERYDATCKSVVSETATSGTVTLATADKCGANGSFDLMFGTSHVTGGFTASVCPVAAGGPACR